MQVTTDDLIAYIRRVDPGNEPFRHAVEACVRRAHGRVIETKWALIRPDGAVAGDGDGKCLYEDRECAVEESSDRFVRHNNYLTPDQSFRVARVQLVEVSE